MSELPGKIHRSNKMGRALTSSPSHMEVLWPPKGNGWPPQTEWDIKITFMYHTERGPQISAFSNPALPNRGIAISLLNWQNLAITQHQTLRKHLDFCCNLNIVTRKNWAKQNPCCSTIYLPYLLLIWLLHPHNISIICIFKQTELESYLSGNMDLGPEADEAELALNIFSLKEERGITEWDADTLAMMV